METLQERFDLIGVFTGVPIYDAKHALAEFKRWYPNLSIDDYLKVLAEGISTIIKRFGITSRDNYMIISKSLGIRIPLEVREDKLEKGFMIGVVPTTLAPHEIKNLRNEIELFVEKEGYVYNRFNITEGFNYYTDKDQIISDFEEIEVI